MNKEINIVLYEPEIAGNVAAIIRTCVAVNAKLHLIEPLGFFEMKDLLSEFQQVIYHFLNIDYMLIEMIFFYKIKMLIYFFLLDTL